MSNRYTFIHAEIKICNDALQLISSVCSKNDARLFELVSWNNCQLLIWRWNYFLGLSSRK